jgi:hypothetical protein
MEFVDWRNLGVQSGRGERPVGFTLQAVDRPASDEVQQGRQASTSACANSLGTCPEMQGEEAAEAAVAGEALVTAAWGEA